VNAQRFRRREVTIAGVEYEVVWDGRRSAPALLPSDYPAVDGAIDPLDANDELLPEYSRGEQTPVSMTDIINGFRRYSGGRE
jgi:hypothetical protein